MGYSPRGCKELDTTEWLHSHQPCRAGALEEEATPDIPVVQLFRKFEEIQFCCLNDIVSGIFFCFVLSSPICFTHVASS